MQQLAQHSIAQHSTEVIDELLHLPSVVPSEQVCLALQEALHAVLLKVAFQSSHQGCEAPESLRLVSHDV